MAFQKAVKGSAYLRLGLIGPAGSGKTMSALRIATALGSRVALIDTEHESSTHYAHKFDYDVCALESFAPERYVAAIHDAEKAGYDVLIIDSLSHAWAGKDGILEFVDAKKKTTSNAFNVWGEATPKHNALIEAMLSAKLHLVITMRSKMEYVQEKDEKTGKTVIRKVGLQPIQREGLDYEFDIVGDLTIEHDLIISKTRFDEIRHDRPYPQPGPEFAAIVKAALAGSSPSAPSVPAATFKPNNANGHTVDTSTGEVLSLPTDGHSNDRPVCVDCHQPIGDVTIKGRLYTAAELVKLAVKAFGVPVCQPCGAARKTAGAANGR